MTFSQSLQVFLLSGTQVLSYLITSYLLVMMDFKNVLPLKQVFFSDFKECCGEQDECCGAAYRIFSTSVMHGFQITG